MWHLGGVELHNLAFERHLISTRYRYWDGIKEALTYFFYSGDDHNWPLKDPHSEMQYQLPGGGRRTLPAYIFPMLGINRFARALWELDKSIRMFMRCAVLHRQTSEHRDRDNFWVETWVLRCRTALYLKNFIYYRNQIQVHFVDERGNCPAPDNNKTFVKLRMNLLGSTNRSMTVDRQEDALLAIWRWMFGCHTGINPDSVVQNMRRTRELTSPRHVSYMYPFACVNFENLREWDNSPRIWPSDGDDLGNMDVVLPTVFD
jgi:hypothetical protein